MATTWKTSSLGSLPTYRRALAIALLAAAPACGGDSVTPDSVASVTVSPKSALLIGIGQVVRLSVSVKDADGGRVSGVDVAWSTSSNTVEVDEVGLVVGVAEGVATVTATAGGVSGSAQIEVYEPEEIANYEVGVSYLGRRGYVEYIPGELPVILSAAHGGDMEPNEIPDRTSGVTATDRNTRELTFQVRDALIALTGKAPHVVISHLDRVKLDPNREIVEAAQGSEAAEQAWHEFQEWIAMARQTVGLEFGRGMYFDMHGHGHDVDRLELGYLLTRTNLNQTDVSLDALAFVASSSIRDIGRESPLPFSQLLRGPTSFGGLLQAEGVRSVPSPSDPSPGTDDYFTGGYNTRQHGSQSDGEVVSGIQIEHHFPGLRDSESNRGVYAERLARVIRAFMLEHYGFFETPPS